MSSVNVFIAALAVWRISHAFVKEPGPLMVFARTRALLASRQRRSGGLFDMVSCVACLSFYVGLIAALWFAEHVFQLFAYALAFSAIAMLLEVLMNLIGRNDDVRVKSSRLV